MLALLAAPSAYASDPAQELADRYAPIVALKDQDAPCDRGAIDGEPWRPTTVDIVLGNPEVSLRGPGKGYPVVKKAPTAADLFEKGPDYFLDFPGDPLRPGCTYAQDGERFAEGQPSATYVHIVAEQGELAVEYWFYYYFNDFNNKHESDWEGIQVVFPVDTVEEALATGPIEVGYAQHEGGEWAEWDDDKLEKVGDHPVVYPAAGSHASYFSDRLWLGRAPSEGIGCDNSTGPSHQVRLSALLVPDEPPTSRGDPLAWLTYEGLWGQREKGPNAGPTGPNTKARWSEPITWQDELRGGSVAVPAVETFGSSASNVFCGAVGFAASTYINYLSDPLITVLLLVGAVLLIGLLIWRTSWRPTHPEPIRERRGVGPDPSRGRPDLPPQSPPLSRAGFDRPRARIPEHRAGVALEPSSRPPDTSSFVRRGCRAARDRCNRARHAESRLRAAAGLPCGLPNRPPPLLGHPRGRRDRGLRSAGDLPHHRRDPRRGLPSS